QPRLENDGQTRRAARNSRNQPGKYSPTTLHYYGPVWQIVLTRAKVRFRNFISVKDNFPLKSTSFKVAEDILAEVIAQAQAEGLALEAEFEYGRDMATVVWNEGTTYRGKLKTLGRQYIKQYYKEAFDPPTLEGNQLQIFGEIQNSVAFLLTNSMFLRDGTDDNGKTNNFSHPCIQALCIDFFYGDKDSLASHFPEDFKDAVPEAALKLVMTCITNCLHEYKSTGRLEAIEFTRSRWLPTHNAYTLLLNQVKAHNYHGRKLREKLQEWAQIGM
ncbi:hypothetical protein CVT26_014014, partial [Gymnopilus dilepis]